MEQYDHPRIAGGQLRFVRDKPNGISSNIAVFSVDKHMQFAVTKESDLDGIPFHEYMGWMDILNAEEFMAGRAEEAVVRGMDRYKSFNVGGERWITKNGVRLTNTTLI